VEVTATADRICIALLATGLHAAATAQAQDATPATFPLTVVTRVYDAKQLLNGPTLSGDARKGRALWLQRCAYCHDGVGQPTYRTMGPWLGAETVQVLGPNALRAIIGVGTERMPGFRYTLQPQQVTALIEFLKTVSADQKPTPEQLARKSSGAAAQVTGE
jgi:mono/diheme cytochrome c family protein